MATSERQFIGSRYVPVVANPPEWSSTKEYEPLTIVLTDDGSSYTSRQYVPSGIEITNTEYWAHTGNYNAALQALQNRVTALETEKPIALLIGDSYLTGYTPTGTVKSWGEYVTEEMPQYDVRTFSHIGAAISYGSLASTVQTAADSMTADEKRRVKYIIVQGFANDLHSNITNEIIESGMVSLKTNIENNFNHANTGLLAVGNRLTETAATYLRVMRAITYYSSIYGIPKIPSSESVLANPNLISSDNIHPTADGQSNIANAAISYLNNSAPDESYVFDTIRSITTTPADTQQQSMILHAFTKDNITYVGIPTLQYIAYTSAVSVNIALLSHIDMGQYNDPLLNYSSPYTTTCMIPIHGNIRYHNENNAVIYAPITGYIRLQDKAVALYFPGILNDNKTGYITTCNVDRITIIGTTWAAIPLYNM